MSLITLPKKTTASKPAQGLGFQAELLNFQRPPLTWQLTLEDAQEGYRLQLEGDLDQQLTQWSASFR